jgi:very-short-patch-repair endonuclease
MFSEHPKSKFWSDINLVKPNEVSLNSHKKFWFDCECGHNFESNLLNINKGNSWCPYCSKHAIRLCENNECNMCFNNSFASIERSKYLHDKTINTRSLFKSTNKIFEFDCDVCNKVFKCQLSGVTKGIWCSFCVNKTEQILFDKLKGSYITLKRQYRVEWCKNSKSNRYLPFDFVIEERKIIIELDGKQHFEQIEKWLSPEETRKNDLYKMNCANKNGFSIIRILQKDVYYNKYDWLNELTNNIENITNDNRIQNIYMCKNNEYKDFDI